MLQAGRQASNQTIPAVESLPFVIGGDGDDELWEGEERRACERPDERCVFPAGACCIKRPLHRVG